MKTALSLGLIIVAFVTAILWGAVTILHFFYFAPDYPPSEMTTGFVEVQNWLALNPPVLIITGALILFLAASRFFERFIPASLMKMLPRRLIDTACIALIAWILIAIFLPLIAGRIEPKDFARHGIRAVSMYALAGGDATKMLLARETRWLLPLFTLLFQLAVVNYILTIAFFAIAGIFGRAMLGKAFPGLEFASLLQEFLFCTAIGLGLIGLAFFFFGLVHLMYVWMVALVMFLALLAGLEMAPGYFQRMWRGIGSLRIQGLAGGLFIILLLIIVSSLHAPLFPVHMHDAMNSHLETPKVFIRDHAVKFYPYINFNNFPLGIDMLYIPMLMLGRIVMTQIVTFFFFLMCLGAVYEFGRFFLKSAIAGMLGAILLCLIPRFVGQFNHPTVDVALTSYIIIAALALAGWLYTRRDKYLQLSGVLIGLALGIKYTAIPFLIIFVFWIIIQRVMLESKPLKPVLRHAGLMILVAVIVSGPWYVRNIVLFGNPFFPFYDNIFGTILPVGTAKDAKPRLQIDEKEMLQQFSYEGDWRRGYSFLTDMSVSAKAGAMRNQLGPLYLAIIPLLIAFILSGLGKLIARYVLKWDVRLNYQPPVWMVLTVVVLYSAYWTYYVGVLHTRYMFPVMPFLAILAAFILTTFFRLERVKPSHALSVTLLAGVGMLAVLYFNQGVLGWKISDLPLQPTSRETFLERNISCYAAVKRANNEISPDSIVYGLFCENCRFYAKFTLIGGLYGYGDHLEFEKNTRTGEMLYQYLKSFGCSYLMVDTRRQQILSGKYAAIKLPADSTFNKHFRSVWREGATEFFEIYD